MYKGKVTYDEKGVLNSEAHTAKYVYPTKEFEVAMSNIAGHGYTKLEVLWCKDAENKMEEIETPAGVTKIIEKAFAKPEKQKTPEQRIAELEAKLEVALSDKKPIKENKDNNTKAKSEKQKTQTDTSRPDYKNMNEDEKLEAVRAEYLGVFGEKPSHLSKFKSLNEKIEKELNK